MGCTCSTQVDLTARLREILINYPEGTSILKELVQNADDAKATGLAFCLDYRKHPTGSLRKAYLSFVHTTSKLIVHKVLLMAYTPDFFTTELVF
jgi:hypothetical protein